MIDFVSELLRETGRVLLDHRARPLEIETKLRHSDLVTDADRASESVLLEAIRRACPDDSILSEESGLHRGASADAWVVDPLDGTANYASGLPDFGIILGRLRHGEPILGAMYLPASDRLYLAERGAGASCNGAPIRVTQAESLSAVLVDHSFHFRDDEARAERELRGFRAVWPHVRGIRSAGCLCYLAQLAEGQIGAFVAHQLGLWDIAGSLLVLEEAGARVTDLAGRPLDLSFDDASWRRSLKAVGAPPVLHDALLARLADAGPSA